MKKIVIILLSLGIFLTNNTFGQQINPQIKKVHVIFKTHLDIGFTQLGSKVEQRYIDEFIPKAIQAAEDLRKEGGKERYVWTTGSWLISAYLNQATPEAVLKLEKAIERGDIVWNGVPYTIETESMTKELFEGVLKLSKRLDARFGKKTIAAKLTDVPGHTRGIISPLFDADMKFLQIGVNSAATVPDVPPVCLWRNVDGKEIVLMYQKTYGEDMILPDNKTAVSINFTNDNKGPHTISKIKEIYSKLRKEYPNAEIGASNLNEVAKDIGTMKAKMPVVTSEIGDTWIYGYASSPIMMAKYRALSRLYTQWLKSKELDGDSDIAIDFAVRLGMVSEHTWGLDVKVFLKNWEKYNFDVFSSSRNLPEFRLMESSWKEKEDNIDKAIAILPKNLQVKAKSEIAEIGKVKPLVVTSVGKPTNVNANGALTIKHKGMQLRVGEIAYQTFSADDYVRFQDAYLTRKVQWAFEDNGKPGLDKSSAKSATVVAKMKYNAIGKNHIVTKLSFPSDKRIDSRVYPKDVQIEYLTHPGGNVIDMNVSFLEKPANRLPEAYWVSFIPQEVVKIVAEKLGYEVDVLDVVKGGNRQMHAIDNYVDIITTKGTIRINSLDAPVMAVGERNALNYSVNKPDLTKGVHFCLFNNLWGTNFSMWFGGSITYRFKIELR
jgi:hypothetical protein